MPLRGRRFGPTPFAQRKGSDAGEKHAARQPEFRSRARYARTSRRLCRRRAQKKSGCEWCFVTAQSRAELESILNAYGQAVDQRSNANDPQGPLNHVLRVFLIDREGRIRNIYSSGTLDPRLVLADVKTLLLEEAKTSKQ